MYALPFKLDMENEIFYWHLLKPTVFSQQKQKLVKDLTPIALKQIFPR